MVKTLQIEVTTFCNARCVYCPVAVYSATWRARHMDFRLFEKIVGEAADVGVEYIHLQGWGEPMLHPRFFDMLRLARRRFATGFTTNGMLLTSPALERLAEVGVDLVAVTFAGASPSTHNKYRVGTDLDAVLKNVAELVKKVKTRVVAVYMMLKDSVEELPAFIEKAAAAGIKEVSLLNLVYVPHPSVYELRAYSNLLSPAPRRVVEAAKAAREAGERLGVVVHSREFSPWELAECPEAPTSSLYVGVDGDVSSCAYLNVPAGAASRCFEGRCEEAPRVVFGNVERDTLRRLAASPRRREFVERFELRKRGEWVDPPEPCRRCYLLYGV